MSINPTRRLAALATVSAVIALTAGLSGTAVAQTRDYPNHPVELVVPFQPGGGTDALARAFADATRKHTTQSVIIVNKPGASGAIGWQDVINAKPDGYRLAVVTVEVTTLPHMGLATSMQTIYDWLDGVGFASFEAAAASVDAQVASAKR